MKISIIYFSQTGNTAAVGQHIADGAMAVEGTEAKCFNIAQEESWDKAFIESSDAVIFGTPVYYANMSWQMKQWFDTKGGKYKLGGKIGGAFSTSRSVHGGGEIAVTTMCSHLLAYGMLVYSGGIAHGRPFIHLGPTVSMDEMETETELCRLFGQRIAAKAHELFDRK